MSRIALAAAVVVAALSCSTTAAQAAKAKRCTHGSVAWRLQGHRACAPSPAKARAGSAPVAAALARTQVSRVAIRPRTRLKLNRHLRRALPRLAKSAGTLATRAAGPWMHKADARGNVVATLDTDLKTVTLDDGTTLTARSHAAAFEDDSKNVSMQIEATRGNDTVRLEPNIEDLLTARPTVACPTADGRVEVTGKSATGGTVVALHAKRVIGAVTERNGVTFTAHGQVGPDARLHDVTNDIVLTREHYERGLQYKATVKATLTMLREGAATLRGTPSVDVRVRQAGASNRAEREAARELAADAAHDPDLLKAIEALGTSGRFDLLRAEPTWYDIPNNCAEIRWDPGAGAELAPGASLTTGGQVTTRDGQPGTGTITVTDVPRGSFGPHDASFTPAAPAPFTATGTDPNEDGTTVLVHVLGASTAGRATNFWSAHHDPVKLPARFTGMVAASSLLPGASSDDWAGTATYTLKDRFPKPDGSVSATYTLTQGSLVAASSSIGDAPSGCRLQAGGSGGHVADGDIEIRVAKDGTATYALLYDVEIPSTFSPVDCQPGQAPPPLDLAIVGMLNTHIAGFPPHENFRRAPKGWHLAAKDTPDVAAAPGATASASWDLLPAG